ncbi:MAG: DUF4838 domain-containing protein [Kiritimatiellae bacterium]|nr:DUF4838 domain-containing protein [Kiritimatiellia bacterium]
MRTMCVTLAGATCLLTTGFDAGAATLVKNGAAQCRIVAETIGDEKAGQKPGRVPGSGLPPYTDEENVRLAVQELQEHLRAMSGAEVPCGGAVQPGETVIRLGSDDSALKALLDKAGTFPETFVLKVDDKSVTIAGRSSDGLRCGVYELLERLGVRWFMPGKIGMVMPQSKDITLAPFTTCQTPSFKGRSLCLSVGWLPWAGPWWQRMRMGGPVSPPCHGINLGPKGGFAQHPELYSLVDSRRVATQHCVSNPETVKLAVATTRQFFRDNPKAEWIGMGPNDSDGGKGFCECPGCRALDAGVTERLAGAPSMTDRYIWFFNQILAGIADEFPDKKLCFYVYQFYQELPAKTVPNQRIVPIFAPITLCRIHGSSNPVCPERSYYKDLMTQWRNICPEVHERGYYANLADPGFPFNKSRDVCSEIETAKRLGVTGWNVEVFPHWGSETPMLYLAAKKFWNAEADVDALLDDYHTKFFGPAAAPMRRYDDLLDQRLRDTDRHTGGAFNMPQFYPPETMAELGRHLKKAESLAREEPYKERVRIFRLTYNYLDAFLAMRRHRDDFDFAKANNELTRLLAVQKECLAYDPPLLWAHAANNYLRAFWSQAVEQGYARTSGTNQFAAAFADEWQFLIDPPGLGEAVNYWDPTYTGGNWGDIKTCSASWSDQGLRYYTGDAWYRQTVKLPANLKGKALWLWFGGVDDLAKVWLNGKLLGTSPGQAFVPFEFDATAVARPGEDNHVVVRVTNRRLDELGTGGINAPVMFYAK